MATVQEITALRLLIAEPGNVEPYTDATLGSRIDTTQDLDRIAYEIWTEKAAKFAQMVDISEGGSSRKMGDLHEQALNMAGVFSSRISGSSERTGPRIMKLRR